ncbi:Calcineurin-like phosphoesterase [Rubritalea squalenifaciens DSM 18772]|uniref:Calcineurin-like phosphoesterase n=2 Tax=Rubritalea TaxID=361050 RepID=A0A1M6H975_9BACT|nr:metallophosphoesterase [Rubritalea squalenifaciens]SHJ18705.1 Calcineurin-like phosphoesterase [Rubritalea squalenifaciens DSM 18772]
MAIFCIGDIHGKFPELANRLRELPDGANVICVGDIGLGFADSLTPHCLDEPDQVATIKNQTVWLMRGNHDDPAIWKFKRYAWNDHLKSIRIPPDIHRMMIGNIHVIMVGGATSLDRGHPARIDGENWWSDEAVSRSAPKLVENMVESYGPADLLCTHCGPIEAQPGMDRDEESFAYYSNIDPDLRKDVKAERTLISQIVAASRTKHVAFGHYHVAIETVVNNVKYRCCAELEPWEHVKRSVLPPLPSL